LKAAVAAPFLTRLSAAGFTLDHLPYLQDVSDDHAVVLWTTLESGAGRVEFSSDRSFSRVAQATSRQFTAGQTNRANGYFQHQATLTGLRPGTQYFYRVTMDGQALSVQPTSFTTAGPGPVNFIVIGDSGQGTIGQAQLATRMAREDVSFALHTGDVAYPDGAFRDFDANFFDAYKGMLGNMPTFLVPGNHDYYTSSGAPYRALTASPATPGVPLADQGRYYSFDWGDVHFIALDTNDPLALPQSGRFPMLDWLERDLQQSRKFWKIAYFHHPPYPASEHHESDEVSAVVRSLLVPILDRYGVPLVLCGHDHNYQRFFPMTGGQKVADGTGTQYIVTGGGGATLFDVPASSPILAKGIAQYHYLRAEVNGPKATIRAISVNGEEIDRFVVSPSPVLSSGGVVNAASLSAGLSPGALVSIYGRFLTVRDDQARAFPLPVDMQGTKVSINGQNIPLIFASPGQINAQLPFGVSGKGTLTVTTGNASANVPISIDDVAPAIFAGPMPAILRNNGTLVTQDSPAQPGDFVSIFMTGMGTVNGSIAAGQAAPNAPLYSCAGRVEVVVGTDSLSPAFAGLAPGFAGVYQVVVQIPQGLRYGMYNLQVIARGAGSNTVQIPVGFPPAPPPPPDPDPTPFLSPLAMKVTSDAFAAMLGTFADEPLAPELA
jgi:uncharacterized protein (TIGR03437 family)